MAKDWTFLKYLKAAFKTRPKVKGLGEVPANELFLFAMGVLGLTNPGFWLLGLGLEAGYLVTLASDPRFQKYLHRLEAAAQTGDAKSRKDALVAGLDGPRRTRYLALEGSCNKLLQTVTNRSVTQQTLDSVNRLLWIFLKLLVSSQVLEGNLQTTSKKKLVGEIEAYEAEYQAAKADPSREKVARSLEATLEIARKRLSNMEQAGQQWEFIQAELLRIEQQLSLMLEEAALNRDDTELSNRVDAVMSTFNQTQEWMKVGGDLLGPQTEDSDLDLPPPTFELQG